MKAPLVLVSATLLAASSFADKVDTLVSEQMKQHHVPAMTVAVVKDGKIVKAKGYGFAHLELESRANRETVYEIGSVTKVHCSSHHDARRRGQSELGCRCS